MAIDIRTDINPKDYFPNAKHIIIYAFSIGDKHYFQYDDTINMPPVKFLKTLVYNREVDMNADGMYLDAHCAAMEAIMNAQELGFQAWRKVAELNDQLKQRRLLPKLPELMYKLAAILFFDEKENTDDYEFGYGERKIAFWKEHTTLTDFFLQKPLQDAIQYLKHAGENLESFSRLSEQADKVHLQTLVEMLPPQLTELKQTLQSRLESYANI